MRRILLLIVSLLAIGGAAAFLAWYLYNPTCTISGTITRDEKPLVWKTDKGVLTVIFVPIDREQNLNVYRAETDRKTGTYRITGIPAGSYRVSIQQVDPDSRYDLLNFALSTKDSTIFRDVTRDGEVLDIDIPKNLAAKGKG